ncbi:hypothetical protein [Anaeroselena agilis]|uniref:Uncharacterized protein n=1 Tax=Anaeroselena agilis TaxID=3063788 RepID=A0ABU3P3F4_9FIRM|nr:hypothetical protein [Selenomonadales bacterium 4137-cl]
MLFKFEYFNPSLGTITVSIAEYGLTFSRAAVEVMSKPDYIVLAFDKEKQVIGVIPTSESEPNKIEFISKLKNGYVRINNKDFIRFLMRYFQDSSEMFTGRAIRYFSYWDEDNKALIVDLKRPLDSNDDGGNETDE